MTIARRHFVLFVGAVIAAAGTLCDPGMAFAQASSAPGEAWRVSPFHGVTSGETGQAIPCVCRYRGDNYRLGDTICMTTHVGTVLARCDLLLNNTTWAPTSTPCVTSRMSRPGQIDDAGE